MAVPTPHPSPPRQSPRGALTGLPGAASRAAAADKRLLVKLSKYQLRSVDEDTWGAVPLRTNLLLTQLNLGAGEVWRVLWSLSTRPYEADRRVGVVTLSSAISYHHPPGARQQATAHQVGLHLRAERPVLPPHL